MTLFKYSINLLNMNSTAKRQFKTSLYDHFARIGKALSNGHRLELLELLAQGERSVETLASETDLSVANASQHLQTLRTAGLLEVRREGTFAYYRLADERVFGLWRALQDLAQDRLAEIDRLLEDALGNRDQIEPVTANELRDRLETGEVVVLDVRPEEEYRAGHIPGARSVPMDSLEKSLRRLPKGKEIIAYCRGPFCIFADEAVARLRERGFEARRLEVGLPDWESLGLPVEVSA